MPTYDVVIKTIQPQLVASIRDVVPTPPEQGGLWGELGAHLGQRKASPTGPCLTIYHDLEYKERDLDVEVCEPLATPVPGNERVHVYELPAIQTMACVVHHGPFVTINEAYQALFKWAQVNGYRIAGPCREVYLRIAEHGSQTDANTVTEIQFPVEKI